MIYGRPYSSGLIPVHYLLLPQRGDAFGDTNSTSRHDGQNEYDFRRNIAARFPKISVLTRVWCNTRAATVEMRKHKRSASDPSRHIPVESIARTPDRRRMAATRKQQHATHAACDPAGRHITTDGRISRQRGGGGSGGDVSSKRPYTLTTYGTSGIRV